MGRLKNVSKLLNSILVLSHKAVTLKNENLEIEVKVKIEDPIKVKERIKELGGVKVAEISQRDVYFSHPCRDFKSTDEALRIREEKGDTCLTYKGPKMGEIGKSRVELEVRLEEGKKPRTILEMLGFKEVGVVEKRRENYRIKDVVLSIDEVKSLGCFLEAEVKGAAVEREKELYELLKKITPSPSIRRSYLEMIIGL